MKTRVYSIALMIIALAFMSAAGMAAQHEGHGAKKPPPESTKPTGKQGDTQHGSMDMSKMMQEPHHVLAMAYLQNVAGFAKALHHQVQATKTVDADFARAAVAEMRRSFDTMQQHMAEHMKAMPADMQSHTGMMQGMEAHISAIRQSLTALERDIQADAPAASKVSERAAEIIKHIDEMAHPHGGHKGHNL